MENYSAGVIELILGPMFSGKSTELLRRVRRFAAADKRALIVSFKGDTRYGQTAQVMTHDRISMRSRAVSSLQEVENEVPQYAVIAVDEAQFLPDLAKYAEKWANAGKTVIVAGLDSTFQRRPFETIQALIPLSESITKLAAVCKICQRSAAFTFRTGSETDVQVVGGAEKYEARCRGCHKAGLAAMKADEQKRRRSGGKSGIRRESWEALADATNIPVSLQALSLR